MREVRIKEGVDSFCNNSQASLLSYKLVVSLYPEIGTRERSPSSGHIPKYYSAQTLKGEGLLYGAIFLMQSDGRETR